MRDLVKCQELDVDFIVVRVQPMNVLYALVATMTTLMQMVYCSMSGFRDCHKWLHEDGAAQEDSNFISSVCRTVFK